MCYPRSHKMRDTQRLRNITPRRSQPHNPRSIIHRYTSHMNKNPLFTTPNRNLTNLTSLQNHVPTLLTQRQILQRPLNPRQVRLFTSYSNNWNPSQSIQCLHVHHVEPGKRDAIKHDHTQLLTMRRTSNHPRNLLRSIETVHPDFRAHYTLKPVAAPENHADNRN